MGVGNQPPNRHPRAEDAGIGKAGGVARASPPPVLRWRNPGIFFFLLSKGVFPAPRGVREPWQGLVVPRSRGADPAFAAVSLGISPLLKNEHLIKNKTKQTKIHK